MAFIAPTLLRHTTFSRSFPSFLTHRNPLHRSSTTPTIISTRYRHQCIPFVSAATTPSAQQSASPPLPTSPTVGFIGLGVMGLPMALNLSTIFPRLVVWNRTPKLDTLVSLQKSNDKPNATNTCTITAADTPASVVANSDITFTMLSTPTAVQSVLHDGPSAALSAISPGKALVDCSTLQVGDMQRTAEIVAKQGGLFLEAPVSGSKVPAEQGQLIFLCGGDRELFDDPVAQRAFDVMGKRAFHLGDVGSGTKMKLVVNQLMATMLAALGESIVLTESVNLSVDDLLDVISLGAMNNPMFALKGPKMKHGAKGYDTNFPLEHAAKDVRFALALGDDNGISMSVSSAANEWYKAAKGLDHTRSDFCAVIESIRASAGRQ